MISDNYYLYCISENGDGVVLTSFTPAAHTSDRTAQTKWALHWSIAPWNTPLFFPSRKLAEAFIQEQGYNFPQHDQIHIARWVSFDACRRNQHAPAE